MGSRVTRTSTPALPGGKTTVTRTPPTRTIPAVPKVRGNPGKSPTTGRRTIPRSRGARGR